MSSGGERLFWVYVGLAIAALAVFSELLGGVAFEVILVGLAGLLVLWLLAGRTGSRASRTPRRASRRAQRAPARSARTSGGARTAGGARSRRPTGQLDGARASGSAPLSRQPARLGMRELERRLGMRAGELAATPRGYRNFTIPKRGGGSRPIRAPNRQLKRVQRRILQRLLDRLPAHPAVHGFERGRSIVTNATPHAGKAIVVRFDLADFFDSTSARRVRRYFRVVGWDAATAELLTDLCTDRGSLPQGAPSSPRLANLVNVRMDARLSALASSMGATYTRYADDLTFSFAVDDARAARRLIRAVKRICAGEGYRLHHGRKLRLRRRHQQQRVTGLVVNDGVRLPRTTLRWLRAVEHHRATGRPATLTDAQLRGWYALEAMVERGA